MVTQMLHRNIFPYKNRMLSMEGVKTEPVNNRSPLQLAMITLANLTEGDSLQFPAGTLTVEESSSEAIRFLLFKGDGTTLPLSVEANGLSDNHITTSLASTIADMKGDYSNDLAELIERDPAVFRLKSNEGWVINDKLCLMTGNIRYRRLTRYESRLIQQESQPAQAGFNFE